MCPCACAAPITNAQQSGPQLGYVGIGWQLNNIPSHYSHLEKYELQEAANLKALRPDIRVSVLRNTEVATVFWDSAKAKMFDPDTQVEKGTELAPRRRK